MFKKLTSSELNSILAAGFEVIGGNRRLPLDLKFERPSGIKFADVQRFVSIQAYSYQVSGYIFGANVGRYCSFGENVQIGRQDHPIDWLSSSPFIYMKGDNVLGVCSSDDQVIQRADHLKKPPTSLKVTNIGHDVWIGHGAYVKAGVTIGTGAIVAGGAVVTKDVKDYSIVGGNPAKHLRYRFHQSLIQALLSSRWWELTPVEIKNLDISNVEGSVEQLESLSNRPVRGPKYVSLGDLLK